MDIRSDLFLAHNESINMADKAQDIIQLQGKPRLRLLGQDGEIIQEVASGNMIVKVGRATIVKMLAGKYGSAVKIAQCALGTGGVGADPFTPIAPLATDVSLYSEVVASRKPIDAVSYTEGNTEAVFTTLFSSEAVNAIVSEAGLFFNDAGKTLFARYTFPSMYLKNDKGYSLEIAWSVLF